MRCLNLCNHLKAVLLCAKDPHYTVEVFYNTPNETLYLVEHKHLCFLLLYTGLVCAFSYTMGHPFIGGCRK